MTDLTKMTGGAMDAARKQVAEFDAERQTATKDKPDPLDELRYAVLAYLSEFDNPIPDAVYRKQLRDHLRSLTGAPRDPRDARR